MKPILAALLLVLVAGCGGSDKPKAETKPSAVETSAAPDNQAACDKLAREWAVAAAGLNSKYALGLVDDATAVFEKMTAATDEMTVELCKGRAGDAATEANFEASLANAHLLVCSQGDMDCWFKVSDEWKAKGEPLLTEVKSLVGLT